MWKILLTIIKIRRQLHKLKLIPFLLVIIIIVYVDQSLISKFEKNERKSTKEEFVRFAKVYGPSESERIINWYSNEK